MLNLQRKKLKFGKNFISLTSENKLNKLILLVDPTTNYYN